MVYGAINKKGEKYYTDLSKLFEVIQNAQLSYNWLITACDCNIPNKVENEYLEQGFCWISGEELTAAVLEKPIQWIWAVLSGFDKDIPLDRVLAFPFPDSEGYNGFWHNPISIQHPLATVEIVPWDSSGTLFFSTDAALVAKFRAGYPQSEDLTEFNARFKKRSEIYEPTLYHLPYGDFPGRQGHRQVFIHTQV